MPVFKAGPRVPEPAGLQPGGAISPLLPVILPLVLSAVLVGAVFSRLYHPAALAAEAPPAKFTDVTFEAGLHFKHDNGGSAGQDPPSTLAGAVAFLDFDNDGFPDLFFVGGTRWPWNPPAPADEPNCALYHNDGHGRFVDVTRSSGIVAPPMGMSVAAGDYDNDGLPDLFITGVGGNRLYHNLGHGRFADVTDAAGVRGDDHVWSTGAVWIDLFGDGKLDLVVCNYMRWARASDLRQAFSAEASGPSYTTPAGFVSVFPAVYRNLGGGKFVDITEKTGLAQLDRETGFPRARPLAVAAVDASGTGRLDLLFTYQSGDDVLYLNQGDGTFRQWTPPAGERHEGASAGLAAASAWSFAPLGRAANRFSVLRAAGFALRPAGDQDEAYCSLPAKLGLAVFDYDLDGRMDIVSADGRAEPGLARFEHGRAFARRPALLWNDGNRWIAAREPAGEGGLGATITARGVAVADLDGNGSLAVVIAQNGGAPRLLRNDLRQHHAWLRIDLVGTKCQRDAGGARVEVYTPRGVLAQTMEPAMGFMAQSEKTLTFGLGDDDRVRKIVVRWPGGGRQEVHPNGVNRRLVITEP
jgi:hypothetical protein